MRFNHYLLIALLTASANAAFTIEPATINIRADRGENSAWIDVAHTGGGPMAIELTVFERVLDIDGEFRQDSLTASTDFVVHPTRIILAPREKARVQVVYKGKRATEDRAYMLFSKEVPLRVEEEGEGVRTGLITLMNYYTILAVSTGKPGRLTFVSSKSLGDGKIEVVVENKSQGRVVGDKLGLKVGNQVIENFSGTKNSIMPGQKRRLVFEFARPVTAKEVGFEYR